MLPSSLLQNMQFIPVVRYWFLEKSDEKQCFLSHLDPCGRLKQTAESNMTWLSIKFWKYPPWSSDLWHYESVILQIYQNPSWINLTTHILYAEGWWKQMPWKKYWRLNKIPHKYGVPGLELQFRLPLESKVLNCILLEDVQRRTNNV